MQFFPPSLGLDISETSIKLVNLKKGEKGFFDLAAFGKEYLSPGTIAEGEIKNQDAFSAALSSVLENEKNGFPKTKFITASLPEDRAFLRVLELPLALKGSELENALKFEIEANIPLTLAEVYYDYEIVKTDAVSAHYDIMVSAVPKKIVDAYLSFFNGHGYQILALEVESTAAQRSLFSGREAQESVLVLDIGSAITRFMIISEGMLRFTSSNSVAGNRFSQTLTEHFSLNLKEAEFMKRVAGLDKNQHRGREMLEVLKPGLAALAGQVKDYINFFETHPTSHGLSENAQKISKVMLTGGGAALWGLADWLRQEVGVPTILGNPLIRIRSNDFAGARMSVEDSLSYTTAIGLAIRNFEEIA
ncbi:MAG: type IV pilus assembly protein PilM [Patescibacteria group bacterium]